MSGPHPTLLRCPQCGSAAREGSEWCSLCYAALRPPAAAPPPAASPPEPPRGLLVPPPPPHPAAAVAALPEQRAERPAPGWPCACGCWVPMAESTCPQCGAGFLAGAAAEPTLAGRPLRTRSRAGRLRIVVLGGLGTCGALLLALLVLAALV